MTSKGHKTELDLNVPKETMLTSSTIAQLVIQILKLLLFQRNQIPLVYTTLKLFISRWGNQESYLSEELIEIENFEFHRYRLNILKTFHGIEEYFNIIKQTFHSNKIIKSVRILLGPTAFTPKEVYTINIPTVFYDHYDETHAHVMEFVTRKLLRSILLSEKLGETFVNPLRPTNVYMDFEVESPNGSINEYLDMKDFCEFTQSCKQIILNIKPESEHFNNFACCRKLKVFEEINEVDSEKKIVEKYCSLDFKWYEINQVIKGFKDNKKFNIWKLE
ncbi:uncharacterized protein LOC129614309 [Condylostylus longicornis]|uniref:uncharacterized protein LOC129614309 n=1 Tax=Condylostylus longicornis TaxID=2530218 RepID=UPI00244DEB45|nr:uncharacterized protein LOC129614309 [Condylostylus longicornis]